MKRFVAGGTKITFIEFFDQALFLLWAALTVLP
jgi:hypothetical protein